MASIRRPGGFTLMEILVVLIVLGLMMAGLTQGLRLGVKALDRQNVALDERAELDAIDRTVRDLVTHIDPGGGRTPVQIDGKADQFHFIGRLPAAAALKTRRADMTILLDDQQRLILRWFPALHETTFGDPPEPIDTVLIDNVDKVQFAYWSPDDSGSEPAGWHDEWNTPFLPYIVRMRLTFPEGDRRHWPDMVMAPLLEQPGG